MFVVDSVLIEPVVDVGFEVDVISKVSRSCWCDKEAVFIWDGVVYVEFFICAFIVLGDESEVEGVICMERGLLLVRETACLNFDINILFNK